MSSQGGPITLTVTYTDTEFQIVSTETEYHRKSTAFGENNAFTTNRKVSITRLNGGGPYRRHVGVLSSPSQKIRRWMVWRTNNGTAGMKKGETVANWCTRGATSVEKLKGFTSRTGYKYYYYFLCISLPNEFRTQTDSKRCSKWLRTGWRRWSWWWWCGSRHRRKF